MPEQVWKLTFTELNLLVDNYYHKQDLQTIQTREIVAWIYNMNRGKGATKKGEDFMQTFEESEKVSLKSKETPTEDQIAEIRKKYGG